MTETVEVKQIEDLTKKSEDKKDIEMEEREKMLNAENIEQSKESKETVTTPDEKKNEKKEGMETKPKKIPIGGIQMPGFFTRSKSKEKCKEDAEADVEGAELIAAKDKAEHSTLTLPKIKIPNPFRKSKVSEDDEKSTDPPKERRNILDTIRLPLVSVFPRKKKEGDAENPPQVDLASSETLEEKSGEEKPDGEMNNIPLEEKKEDENVTELPEPIWMQYLRTYRVAISALLVFFLILIIILSIALSGKDIPRYAPIKDGKFVETITSCGRIEGLIEDSAVAYRGIPYARPPINDLRFKYAQPLNDLKYCWNDTFLAHNSTPNCLQMYGNGTISGSEDCLTLDVVTPYVRYDNPLPVVVLIGAESLIGGSPGKMRPSARYARSRDVVFVRPNFRLGALGFLALEALSRDEYPPISGNYGLSDILEALKWVQLNIEHFGGDPKSVTLFGHRAGATLVTALSTMKKANKFFTRAWASSGGAIYPKRSLSEAEVDNKRFLDMVQCTNASCLRQVDAKKLINAVEDTWRKPQLDLPAPGEDPSKYHEWLVIDGKILQEHPATIWANEVLPVQLILGSTAHAASSNKLLMKHATWTEALVKTHLEQSFLKNEANLTKAMEMYQLNYTGLAGMISDIRTVCPLLAISTQMQKVPFYVVTQARGELNISDIESDVDAILGRYEPRTPEQRRYVSAMQGLFYHYVWHGKLEHVDGLGKKVLIVGQDVLPNATYSECAFWISNNVVLKYAALD